MRRITVVYPSRAKAFLAKVANDHDTPCLLCGEPAASIGVWYPTAAERRRLGQPDGQEVTIGFALCEKHATEAFVPEIEATAVADITAALARPECN